MSMIEHTEEMGSVEDAIVEIDTEINPDQELQDLEERAKRMGWVPKDRYKGPPGRWRDAKTFIEHGENELPVLRERIRTIDRKAMDTEAKLTAELTDTKAKLTEMSEVMNELREMSKRSEEIGYNRARTEIETRMRSAVETSNVAEYDAARRELDRVESLRTPERPPVRPEPRREEAPATNATNPQSGTVDPEIVEWTRENPWFERDQVLKVYAIDKDADLMRRFPGMSTRDRLEEVYRQTVTKFPEKFGNPRRAAAASVSTSSPPPPRSRTGKAYEDLPPEAKAACDRYVKDIPGYKREDYVKTYFAGEE